MSTVTVGKNGRLYARKFDWDAAARRYQDGETIAQIAASLDVAPRAVHRVLVELGVPRRPAARLRGPTRHGTETAYTDGCRCGACRTAANTARSERRQHPNVSVHGTHSSYSSGCRCDDCRTGHNAYRRRQRASA